MNYDNKTLEKSLENLVKPMLIRRELYAKLDTALIQSMFFQGSITKLAIYNAKNF